MILDLKYEHTDYYKHIFPFMAKIFLDTSIMKIFIDGFIKEVFSKQKDDEYENLISLLEKLKLKNNYFEKEKKSLQEKIVWNKFWITPQVFTEICQHLCKDEKRNKRHDFNQIVKELIPIFYELNEEEKIEKEKIINLIDEKKPVIELGDFSIFIAVDDITKKQGKISVLAKDKGIKGRFENYPNVLMIDYDKAILGMY